MAMMSQFFEMTWPSKFLTLLCFSCQVKLLIKVSVNIITGSGVMTFSFYKGLTRNPEIGNTTVWVLPNIWTLGGKLEIPDLALTSLTECYWMLQNAAITAFNVSALLRENQQGGNPPDYLETQIRDNNWVLDNFSQFRARRIVIIYDYCIVEIHKRGTTRKHIGWHHSAPDIFLAWVSFQLVMDL